MGRLRTIGRNSHSLQLHREKINDTREPDEEVSGKS